MLEGQHSHRDRLGEALKFASHQNNGEFGLVIV
jgi:hypothetical protein